MRYIPSWGAGGNQTLLRFIRKPDKAKCLLLAEALDQVASHQTAAKREAEKEMKAMLAVSQAENARLHQEMAETRFLLARWYQEAERRKEKHRADHQREYESLNALLAQAIGKKQGQKQQHRDQQQGIRQ